MSPDLKRLCEAAVKASGTLDIDYEAGYSPTEDPAGWEDIVRAVLMELREVGEGVLAAGSIDLIREAEDPWDAISPELQAIFGVSEQNAMSCAPAEELIRPNMKRAFTAMIDHILAKPTEA